MQHRTGLKIIKPKHSQKNFIPEITTQFAFQFGALATKNIVALDETQKERWLQGYDLSRDQCQMQNVEPTAKAVLILHQGFCIGWGKIINGKIKNKLDRNLVY